MSIGAGVLFIMLAVANAKPDRSPVISAISASADPMSLTDLIGSLDDDGKKSAIAGLDRLDRAALGPEGLTELSEAYRLLGRNDDALKVARALSFRDPARSLGEVLSIKALAAAGDFTSAQAASEAGLKRFPGDRDLLALLHQVKGRGASRFNSGQADYSAQIHRTPSLQAVPSEPAPRAPVVFSSRRRYGESAAGEIPYPSGGSNAAEQPGAGGVSWARRKIGESIEAVLKRIDRTMGLLPEERAAAVKGAENGAVLGAGIGAVGGGLVAGGVCAPALVTGVPYGACVVAGGSGGALVGTPSGAYIGGLVSVKYNRVMADFNRIFGSGAHEDAPKVD